MRGAMYEKMNNLDAAEAQFRKVLEINPQNAGAMNYLGYMLADRNIRLQEAFKLIAKAVELEPNNGAYLDSLGWVNFRLGKLDEAETALRRAWKKRLRTGTREPSRSMELSGRSRSFTSRRATASPRPSAAPMFGRSRESWRACGVCSISGRT